LFGTVNVQLIPEDDAIFQDAYGALSTKLYGTAFPTDPFTQQEDMDGCQLTVPANVTCNPACDTGICTANNQCTPKPAALDSGTLHVTGLKTSSGGTSFDVTPGAANFYMSETLPFPPCNEGDAITVTGTGFSLAGTCIEPLTVTSTTPIPLVDSQKKAIGGVVTWTPPTQQGISRIRMVVEISHHGGGEKGQINCDVPDTGSFTIPQQLVADLIALGTAGYPTIEVTRVSTATSTAEPGVQLLVSSDLLLDVDTGVISCGGGNTDTPVVCPTGQTCQAPPYVCQ
jgi:hypothetical protein